jgi:hypothetical protein
METIMNMILYIIYDLTVRTRSSSSVRRSATRSTTSAA